jgi:hypothetical protein
LRDHHSQQLFRAIHGYFANFSRSVGSISEEIYSQQAVYLSYTLMLQNRSLASALFSALLEQRGYLITVHSPIAYSFY